MSNRDVRGWMRGRRGAFASSVSGRPAISRMRIAASVTIACMNTCRGRGVPIEFVKHLRDTPDIGENPDYTGFTCVKAASSW